MALVEVFNQVSQMLNSFIANLSMEYILLTKKDMTKNNEKKKISVADTTEVP